LPRCTKEGKCGSVCYISWLDSLVEDDWKKIKNKKNENIKKKDKRT
jgi:hypothetical protein